MQTAAYRDVIRRTRRTTTWLAFVDADEFLFSPKGPMPEQLRAYETYPAVSVNWILFGPNGHVRRPEGLVMDNYTTTFADYGEGINHHTKAIVQPRVTLCMNHVHYAILRGKRHAVDEDSNAIDNFPAYTPHGGKAFTRKCHQDVFRINHYQTKSIEDLEEKSQRGYPDGTPKMRYDAYSAHSRGR